MLLLADPRFDPARARSEEHTSELQSQSNLVCRLLLEKKKKKACYATLVVYMTAIGCLLEPNTSVNTAIRGATLTDAPPAAARSATTARLTRNAARQTS